VLRALYEFHLLTVEQLTRLLYAKTSRNYVGAICKRLADAGYLLRTWLPRHGSQGRAAAVYLLGRPGMRYLARQGYTLTHRARPSEHGVHGAQFLLHTLAVSDVLIAAQLLERRVEGLLVAALRHEYDLKRTAAIRFAPGQVDPTGSVYVVPDGWLDIRLARADGTALQLPLWLELDRGTEAIAAIKRKVRGIVAYHVGGHYGRVFGTNHLQVVFLVDRAAYDTTEQAAHRVDQIRRWCEEELTRLDRRSYGSIVRVAVLPAREELDPLPFFTAPHCREPFSPTPVALLAVVRGQVFP
jgi:hypothetical protein